MTEKTKYLLVGMVIGFFLSAAAGGVYIFALPDGTARFSMTNDRKGARDGVDGKGGMRGNQRADAPTADAGEVDRLEAEASASPGSRHDNPDERYGGEEPFRPDPYELKERFPDNLAIPPVSREEFERKRAAKEERQRLHAKITANKATREEIRSFYSRQEQLAKDSIEILSFILQEYVDEMSERDLKKNEFLLEQFQKRLAAIPDKEVQALDRLEK